MEDYEYLYLLNQTSKEAGAKNLEALLNIDDSIVESMSDYTKNPEVIYQRRQAMAGAIESLSEKTKAVETDAKG